MGVIDFVNDVTNKAVDDDINTIGIFKDLHQKHSTLLITIFCQPIHS